MTSIPDRSNDHHSDRAVEQLAHEAATFIAREGGTESLITVTRALLSSRGDRATIFITVFPENKIPGALFFLEHQRQEFSEHLKKHTRLKPLPRVTFMIDDGEANRRRIDELSHLT